MIGPWSGAILFAIGIALNTAPLARLLEDIWMRGIDQGWATLIGAVVGLSAVAWQTGRGFSHLMASQKNQAELDREARIDQAKLERQQLEWRKHQEARELAASLRGELIAAYYNACRLRQDSALMAAVFDAMINKGHRPQLPFQIRGFHCPVYEANAHRIGSLGADLGADLAQVFATLIFRPTNFGAEPVDVEIHKIIHNGIKESLSETIDDILHTIKRLRAFESGEQDPGSLEKNRMEREKEKRMMKTQR